MSGAEMANLALALEHQLRESERKRHLAESNVSMLTDQIVKLSEEMIELRRELEEARRK